MCILCFNIPKHLFYTDSVLSICTQRSHYFHLDKAIHILHIPSQTLQWATKSLVICGLVASALVSGTRAQHHPASIVDTNEATAINSSHFTARLPHQFLPNAQTTRCNDFHGMRRWPRESGQQNYQLHIFQDSMQQMLENTSLITWELFSFHHLRLVCSQARLSTLRDPRSQREVDMKPTSCLADTLPRSDSD